MSKIAITNIGKIVSGDLKEGVLEGKNTIIVHDGKISEIKRAKDVDVKHADVVVDANGMTVMPGLIDTHIHPAIGDWAPMFRAAGYWGSVLWSGTTTAISQGEYGVQGRPQDPAGIKALALLAKKTFDNLRPGGVKVYGGALILHPAFSEKDFKELKSEGIWLTAEIGATHKEISRLTPVIELAKKYNMKVMMHIGGRSIPESMTVTAEDVMKVEPDVVSHINGGPTSPNLRDIKTLIKETELTLEVAYGGNPKTLIETVKLAKAEGKLERIITGSDSPTETASLGTNAIMRTIIFISSMAEIPGEQAIAMATGNTAQALELKEGKIKEGWTANLLIADAPEGSIGGDALKAVEAGDLPGIAFIMAEGKIIDPPPIRVPQPRRSIHLHKR
jgi:enamidase